MTDSGDDLNLTQWVAVVLLLLCLLVPLAVALAAWCKQRYAHAVVRLQAEVAGTATAPAPVPRASDPAPDPDPTPPPRPLTFHVTAAAGVPRPADDPSAPAQRLRRRVIVGQFVAGLVYWWLLLLAMLFALFLFQQLTGGTAAEDDATAVGALATQAIVWPLLLLPPVLGWAFTAGLNEGRVWAAGAAATALFGVGLALAGSGGLPALIAAGTAGLMAAMMAAFLRPAVRGAGPPLVAALTIGLLVFALLTGIAAALDPDDGSPTTTRDWALGIPVLLLFLALGGVVAHRTLRRIARRYAAKRFSDVQLAQGAYWGLITVFSAGTALMLSFEPRTGAAMEWVAAAILLLWLLWRGLQRVALWALARRHAPPPLPALLLLRVFKPSGRSEAFSDRFLARWRFAGPVWMIAGPDLAGAYMEPDEFLAFVDRSLRTRFIADVAELPARLAALDGARDPDGRCRVSELFCSNHTWRAAVLALMERAGVVLLDLREYTPARAGTRFELEEVLRRVPLARVLVLIDAIGSPQAAQDEIQAAWQRIGAPRAGHANHAVHAGRAADGATAAATLTLLQVGPGSAAEMQGLLRAAARAALT